MNTFGLVLWCIVLIMSLVAIYIGHNAKKVYPEFKATYRDDEWVIEAFHPDPEGAAGQIHTFFATYAALDPADADSDGSVKINLGADDAD